MDRAEQIAQELAGLGLEEPLMVPQDIDDAEAPELGEDDAPQAVQDAPQEPAEPVEVLPPLRTTEAQRAAAERLAGALKLLRDSFEGVIEAAEVLCCTLTEDGGPTEVEVEVEGPEESDDHVVAEPAEALEPAEAPAASEDDVLEGGDDGVVVETDDKETVDDAEVSEEG